MTAPSGIEALQSIFISHNVSNTGKLEKQALSQHQRFSAIDKPYTLFTWYPDRASSFLRFRCVCVFDAWDPKCSAFHSCRNELWIDVFCFQASMTAHCLMTQYPGIFISWVMGHESKLGNLWIVHFWRNWGIHLEAVRKWHFLCLKLNIFSPWKTFNIFKSWPE